MAAGDVEVRIIAAPFTEASIDSVVTGLRVTANDKWLMTALDSQVIIVHIEEA